MAAKSDKSPCCEHHSTKSTLSPSLKLTHNKIPTTTKLIRKQEQSYKVCTKSSSHRKSVEKEQVKVHDCQK